VAIERNADSRLLGKARDLGAPVLVRDMREDQALVDAGIRHARAIIIATNDELVNLEVALDARRLNPSIRILMRLFDQQIAPKLTGAFGVDAAFSSSALAAPTVVAMALGAHALTLPGVGGASHVALELTVQAKSALHGRTVAAVETAHGARVLTVTARGGATLAVPPPDTVLAPGDALVVFVAAARTASLEAAAREPARP
jgi:Trk K+ transport system NAD-binding subunit